MTKRTGRIGMVMAGALALGGWLGSADASVVAAIDTMGTGSEGYGTFGYNSNSGDYIDRGMRFTATETITLSTFELVLGKANLGGVDPSGTAQIELLTDVSDRPGDLLEDWTSPYLSGPDASPELVTLSSEAQPTLTAGQSYWVVVRAAEGSQLSGAWFFPEDDFSGSYRTLFGETGTAVEDFSYSQLTRPLQVRLSGVPEPATAAVLAVGVGGVLCRRARGVTAG